MMHSGSLRHYSDRLTLRWDMLAPDWLDRSLPWLRAEGYVPFLVLETWEEPQFRDRFAGHSAIGALDWDPIASLDGVNIYALP